VESQVVARRRGWVVLALGLVLSCRPAPATSPPAAAAATARPFRCGAATCDARTSYCQLVKTDVLTLPSTYSCVPLPAACLVREPDEAPGCGCFAAGTRCDLCSRLDGPGAPHLQRTCVGGR